ncbi:putative class I hydrophobin superfamily [Pleurotus ostreatus PC15]|uniref:Hydrophobin n=1 Tax=Pleurotus ostreatus (strain PC15) TaxID=1137138 RepID=A0A067NH06_PLEO1|nr:putative class I hydrophobin superfamily [Pleurotus ostreatus PC15]
MFAQSIFVAAIAAVATASPLAARTDYKCNTGPVQCCNTMKSHESSEGNLVASLLKLDISGITGELGLQCSPVANLIGGGPNSGQTVCCENTKFNGLVNIGCTPINIGL